MTPVWCPPPADRVGRRGGLGPMRCPGCLPRGGISCYDRRRGTGMYAGRHAEQRPEQAAFIMASTGEVVTYGELETRANRLAHLLRRQGLRRLDHYSIFMENNNRYLESCAAGERAGLYYTCVNSFLTAPELAYILHNSESRVLIT